MQSPINRWIQSTQKVFEGCKARWIPDVSATAGIPLSATKGTPRTPAVRRLTETTTLTNIAAVNFNKLRGYSQTCVALFENTRETATQKPRETTT